MVEYGVQNTPHDRWTYTYSHNSDNGRTAFYLRRHRDGKTLTCTIEWFEGKYEQVFRAKAGRDSWLSITLSDLEQTDPMLSYRQYYRRQRENRS